MTADGGGEQSAPLQPLPTWGLGDVWITLALYLFLAFVGAALVLGAPNTPDGQAWALVGALALPWIGLAGWPIAATRIKGRGPVTDLRLRATPRQVGLGVGAGLLGLLAAGIVAALVERWAGTPLESSVGEVAEGMREASPWPLLALAVLTAFGAPVVEELAFRGLFVGALQKRRAATAVCVTVPALVFASFHLEPTRFVVLLVIGAVLGWVRVRTGSTGASIAAHMANNIPGAIALALLAFD